MEYNIRYIGKPEVWENFVKSQPYTLFVQSPLYGDFYRAMGERAWLLGVYRGDTLVGGSLVLTISAKRGKFLYVPYGPIGSYDQSFFDELKKLAKRERAHWIRVAPFLEDTPAARQTFKSFGFRDAPIHILAETTWLLPLAGTDDELLANMNKNHRNLIRRCAKEGVRILTSTDAPALARFQDLLDATTTRHGFHRFSRTYIEEEFRTFATRGEAVILEGYLPDGVLDASAIIFFYGTMACYRHGASLGKEKHLPSSYLVQWNAILEAKRRGCSWYNFWGIAPDTAGPRHPFSGITHFKKGFGGRAQQLLRCQDLPLSPKYAVSWLVETGRKLKRGF